MTPFHIYLIAIHLLALPGLFMLAGGLLTWFLESTTNVETGEPKPWARGMGWGLVGFVIACVLWLSTIAWSRGV